jgi:hypothetical protein
MFPLILLSDIVSINLVTLILGKYWSVWRNIMMFSTDEINNFHSKGLEIHYHYYHNSSYVSNNVCFDLQTAVILYIYIE